MSSFIGEGSAKYNSALAAAFLRFLTTETGQNSSSALGKRVKKLEDAKPGKDNSADVKAAAGTADKALSLAHELKTEVQALKKKRP
jgi:hypothetical protein